MILVRVCSTLPHQTGMPCSPKKVTFPTKVCGEQGTVSVQIESNGRARLAFQSFPGVRTRMSMYELTINDWEGPSKLPVFMALQREVYGDKFSSMDPVSHRPVWDEHQVALAVEQGVFSHDSNL